MEELFKGSSLTNGVCKDDLEPKPVHKLKRYRGETQVEGMAKKRNCKEESNELTWEIPRRVTSDGMMMPYLRRAERSMLISRDC